MKKTKIIGWVALAALIIIQFFRIDKTNPEYDINNDFITIHQPPEDVKLMLKEACYDCHSNESRYPWYTNIAPISFWVKGHIDNGRKHLNFSDWGTFSDKKKDHKIDETIEYVGEGWMPIGSYKIAHSSARLTDEQRQRMVAYFTSLQ
ncbi:MAG: heme-binding domain-containing protein [Saprospiraceae bacterium]|nr:heme-binding domain-containing protein [Saprospiraceae bacterium]